MAIVGRWTLHYSWGCDGSYYPAELTFNNDGTFIASEDSENFPGKWAQNDGMILWQYDGYKTTYGGNFAGNVMVGMMSGFEGGNDNGCWYAIKAGSIIVTAAEAKAEFYSSGKKAK
jgi:hypothetical protein